MATCRISLGAREAPGDAGGAPYRMNARWTSRARPSCSSETTRGQRRCIASSRRSPPRLVRLRAPAARSARCEAAVALRVRYHQRMPPALVKQSATISVRDGTSSRIVVVADTHSRPHAEAHARLRALEPEAILHAGDIGDLAVLDALAKIAPVHAVRGNIDTRANQLPDMLTIDVVSPQRTTRLLLVHIAVYGPRLRAEIAKLARAEKTPLVVCGHSHVPFIGEDRGITVFNPGSIGPRRFQLPIVFGTIDFTPSGLRLAHIDCETGQRWLPPA